MPPPRPVPPGLNCRQPCPQRGPCNAAGAPGSMLAAVRPGGLRPSQTVLPTMGLWPTTPSCSYTITQCEHSTISQSPFARAHLFFWGTDHFYRACVSELHIVRSAEHRNNPVGLHSTHNAEWLPSLHCPHHDRVSFSESMHMQQKATVSCVFTPSVCTPPFLFHVCFDWPGRKTHWHGIDPLSEVRSSVLEGGGRNAGFKQPDPGQKGLWELM